MARDLLLGRLHPDMACAVALSIVEDPHVVVNLESVTLYDESMRSLGCLRDWLTSDDPLDSATRAYLQAKRDHSRTTARGPGQTAWNAAAAAKSRDQATHRARQARDLGRQLLAERGVIARARQVGLKLIGVD
jgi:hypothetical protein